MPTAVTPCFVSLVRYPVDETLAPVSAGKRSIQSSHQEFGAVHVTQEDFYRDSLKKRPRKSYSTFVDRLAETSEMIREAMSVPLPEGDDNF